MEQNSLLGGNYSERSLLDVHGFPLTSLAMRTAPRTMMLAFFSAAMLSVVFCGFLGAYAAKAMGDANWFAAATHVAPHCLDVHPSVDRRCRRQLVH